MTETFYEEFASILEACEIEEEEETSGNAATLHTPAVETPAVGASADVRPRVADGGGEGTKAATDEGAERGMREVAENEDTRPKERARCHEGCVRPSGSRGPRGCSSGKAATPEVVEDTEAKSTDAEVGSTAKARDENMQCGRWGPRDKHVYNG